MENFGETIRSLRIAQELGLRETASKIRISPAYLSRIERGKESPPRPEVIKDLARVLAADPDVLFRLSSSTDPAVVDFLHKKVSLEKDARVLFNAARAAGVTIEMAVFEDLDHLFKPVAGESHISQYYDLERRVSDRFKQTVLDFLNRAVSTG